MFGSVGNFYQEVATGVAIFLASAGVACVAVMIYHQRRWQAVGFIYDLFHRAWQWVVPLTVLTVVVLALLLSGNMKLAQATSQFGFPLLGLGILSYIALFHSRRRWPHLSAFERFKKIATLAN